MSKTGSNIRKETIHVPKASEIVSSELRNKIIRGEIKEGEMLAAEAELMSQFGVSRPTLREAVRILESEKLITVSRGARGGVIANAPCLGAATRYFSFILQSEKLTLMDIFDVNALIEPIVVRNLAENRHADATSALRRCLEEDLSHADDDVEFGRSAVNFRNILVEQAGTPVLTLAMTMLNDIFIRYWETSIANTNGKSDTRPNKRRFLRAVQTLIDHIEAGDGDKAEAHWRKHCARLQRALRAWVDEGEVIDILDS